MCWGSGIAGHGAGANAPYSTAARLLHGMERGRLGGGGVDTPETLWGEDDDHRSSRLTALLPVMGTDLPDCASRHGAERVRETGRSIETEGWRYENERDD